MRLLSGRSMLIGVLLDLEHVRAILPTQGFFSVDRSDSSPRIAAP